MESGNLLITSYLWVGFAGGLFAFSHCLGMCGGFVLYISQGKNIRKMMVSQLLWHLGKLSTYLLIGAIAGYAGGFVEVLLFDNAGFRNILTYLAGAVIVLAGLSLLGLLPVGKKGLPGGDLFAAVFGKLFRSTSPEGALIAGIATGCLPCPIVIAFAALSLQTGSVLTGMATMGGLGVGTMVPLLLFGAVGRLTGMHLRSWSARAGGIILVVLGLITVLRGTEIYHQFLGCPPKPVLHQAEAKEIKPCCPGKTHGSKNGN